MNASKVVMKIVSISFSILVMILIVLCLYQGGRMAYDFGYRVFTEQAVDTEENAKEKVVQISSEMSARDIGALLEKKRLVRSADLVCSTVKIILIFPQDQSRCLYTIDIYDCKRYDAGDVRRRSYRNRNRGMI